MNRIMFLYWGRRGLSRFTLNLMEAAALERGLSWHLSLSSTNEDYDRFLKFENRLLTVRTFDRSIQALTKVARIHSLRRQLAESIRSRDIEAVVNLMPHVWSPFVIGAVRQAGARYVTLLHDAQRHPGDRSGLAHRLLLLDAERADHIVTLSLAVTKQATERLGLPAAKITTLFHPHFSFDMPSPPPAPESGEPWRLLAIGRIMSYKGLPLLVEAMERLRAEGFPVSLSIMGSGDLGGLEPRLRALGGRIVNRWLSEEDIEAALRDHHAVALSHIEASQSGVAAAGLGAGLPVVAFATGGLAEQVEDGTTGLLARAQTAEALAEAIRRLASPGLYGHLVERIAATNDRRSMRAFLQSLLAAISRQSQGAL